jgi:EpsI family protein
LLAAKNEPLPITRPLKSFPIDIDGWKGRPAPPMEPRILAALGVDDYLDRIYISQDRTIIGLYIGYYQSQRQGDTVHSPLNCLPGAGWNPTKRKRITIPVKKGLDLDNNGDSEQHLRNITVNSLVIRKGYESQVVIYWYQSQGRVVASEYWGKIFTVVNAIRTNRTDTALVRVVTPVRNSGTPAENSAEKHAIMFVKSLCPLLENFLPG